MNKSNVLVVTRNLPPLVGGMERLIWHVLDELRQDYKVHVVGPKGCKNRLPQDVSGIEVQLKPMVLFLLRAGLCALWSALRLRPTIIFAGSGLTAPIVWIIARLLRCKCGVYLHGLDVCAQHPVYQLLWVPLFRHFDAVIVNSHYTKQLAIKAKVPASCISILHPGVKIPAMDYGNAGRLSFRSRHGFGSSPLLLYVGRITPRKGLLPFIDNILQHIVAEIPTVMLVVIGGAPINALQTATDEYAAAGSALKKKGLAAKVCFLGSCTDEELDAAYFAADILVFPVQENAYDIEGFGMVAIEAAAHGLPTVAFAVGGVPDAVSHGSSGKLILSGDNIAFAKAVVKYINDEKTPDQSEACKHFAQLFAWNVFGDKLRKIFRSVTNGSASLANI